MDHGGLVDFRSHWLVREKYRVAANPGWHAVGPGHGHSWGCLSSEIISAFAYILKVGRKVNLSKNHLWRVKK